MRKSTKLMAGLGVVAGLGVALAPLATFATAAGTDHLTVTVSSACNMTSGEADDESTQNVDESEYTAFNRYFKATVPAGSSVILDASKQVADAQGTALSGSPVAATIHIQCNDAYPTGTTVSASTTGHGWSLKGLGQDLTGGTTGATIENVDPSDGATSGWGVKLTKTPATGDDTTIVTGYTDYKALPDTATVIAFGSTAAANATITIDSYKVSAAPEQAADTYTGDAVYTFFAPQE